MSLNVGKFVYAVATRIAAIMVHLDPTNASTPWVCLLVKSTVPDLGLKLEPKGMASTKEKHVLRSKALLSRCRYTLESASVPHKVMPAVVGGIMRYVAPYHCDNAAEVVRSNTTIKIAALQFDNRPKDICNVVVRCGTGLKLVDIRVMRHDSVVVTAA